MDDALSGWFDAPKALWMALIDGALQRTVLGMQLRAGLVQAAAEIDEGPVEWSFQPGWVDAEGPSIPDRPFEVAGVEGSTTLVASERMGRGDWWDRGRSFRRNGSRRWIGLGRHAEMGSSGPP